MVQVKGFKHFLKLINDNQLTIKYERVKKANWCIYYCVYCTHDQKSQVQKIVDQYNSTKTNHSYINVYDHIELTEIKL